MEVTVAEIDWGVVSFFRLASIFIQVVFLMEMVMLLSHYWWRIIPLRKEVVARKVLAPPVIWTFCYHLFVTLWAMSTVVSQTQRLVTNDDPTVGTYLNPMIMLFGLITIRMFVRYYSQTLTREEHERYR